MKSWAMLGWLTLTSVSAFGAGYCLAKDWRNSFVCWLACVALTNIITAFIAEDLGK